MSSATNWGALLKRTYGPAVDPIPSDDTIASDAEFIPAEKRPGDTYEFPIRLKHEGAGAYNLDHSSFAIGSAIDSVEESARLQGAEIAVWGDVPIGMATKMNSSKGESSRAYDQALGRKLAYLMEAAELRRELSLLYGSGTSGLSNLGVVSSVVDQTGTNLQVTVTRATYIGGLWHQLIGMEFDFHTSGGTSHTANAAAVLTAVNKTNTQLTFTKSGSDTSFAASDQIRFRGSRVLSMVGLQAILENTGSLFNISATTYPQWRAESYAVGGALTFDKVVEGLSGSAENGLSEGVTLYVCNRSWTDLMTDEAALVRRIKDEKKIRRGYNSIAFDSQVGPIEIKAHKFMKQGIAMALPMSTVKRVGSTDVTFRAPGTKNDWFYTELQSNMGFRVKCYQDQAVVCEIPYHCTLFTGISNTSDVIPA